MKAWADPAHTCEEARGCPSTLAVWPSPGRRVGPTGLVQLGLGSGSTGCPGLPLVPALPQGTSALSTLRAAIAKVPSVPILQWCDQTRTVMQLTRSGELCLLPAPFPLPPAPTQALTEVGHPRPPRFAGWFLSFWRMTASSVL